MDVYCLAFTFPKAGGPLSIAAAAAAEGASSSVTLPASSRSPFDALSALPSSSSSGVAVDPSASLGPTVASAGRSTANGADFASNKDSTSSVNDSSQQSPSPEWTSAEQRTAQQQQQQRSSGRTSSAIGSGFSSMRSRFPPSVKAFMPSAFGGSKRTNDRILEGVSSAGEKAAEGDGEGEVEAEGRAQGPSSSALNSSLSAKKNDGKDSVLMPQSLKSLNTAADVEDERIDASSAAPQVLDKTVGGASSLRDSSPPAGFMAFSGAAALSHHHHHNNRDSRSTVGTRSSFDQSSSTSFSTDNSNFGGSLQFGGSHSRKHYSSEPTSVSHSAANSLSAPGGLPSASHNTASSGSAASSIGENVNRLAHDVMAHHQCLVSVAESPQQGTAPTSISAPHSSSPAHVGGGNSLASSSVPSLLPFPTSSSQVSTPLSAYPYQHHQIQPTFLGNGAGSVGRAASSSSGNFGLTLGPASASSLSLNSIHGQSPSLAGTGLGVQGQMADNGFPGVTAGGPAAASAAAKMPGASFSSPEQPRYCFFLSGGYQQVMAARGELLRDHPFKIKTVVKVPRAELLEAAPSNNNSTGSSPLPDQQGSASGKAPEVLKQDVRKRLDEIALLTHAHIAIVSNESRGTELGYGLATERNVDLVISGSIESIDLARVRVLVFLDELNGLHSEACELDYKLHNIIGGRKRCVIQTIQEESAANIYFPSSFSGVLAPSDNADLLAQQNTVYITGEYFNVQRARDMLFQVSLHKSKCIISRDTAVLPRKLDWMLLERMDDIKSIVIDNGSFINFPPIGSQSSLLTVYGDNRVSIERTIRAVMALASQHYVASIWLLPVGFDVFASQQMLTMAQITPALKHISTLSGAEVVFKSNCFEVHGLESEVRSAVSQLLDLDVVKPFNFEVRFQIELATEHRDFISGKKNGKINKIMKQCNVRIKFETFNEYNFLIDVSGNDRYSALQGLSFLQEELPAELSFHVPEAYHKRIIGVGGKNIQRIMKKYGVYVKFSNAEEFASLGGYFDNEDNVVARTPAKNAINLEHLKQSVMEMVSPKDKDYVVETLPIARRYHRVLLGEKAIFLHDIESKTNTIIRFPPRESASDLVSVFGPESQLHIAAQMLLEHVPFEAEFRTPSSRNLATAISSPDFSILLERIRHELNVHIVPITRPGTGEGVFKMRLNRSNCDYLPAAKNLLEDFLTSRNVSVYASAVESRTRSDSFASSLPHFANKLISPAAAESVESFQEAARNHERRLRAPASTPDVKALFDAPPRATQHTHSTSQQLGRSPFGSSSAHPSPYLDRVSGFGSEVWGPPTQVMSQQPSHSHSMSMSGSVSSSVAGAGGSISGIEFPHYGGGFEPSVRKRIPSAMSLNYPPHRVSDSGHMRPPHEQDNLMGDTFRKARGFGNRAQSLDIGALPAQQQAQAASALRPFGAHMLGMAPAPSGPYGHVTHQSISRLPPASTGARMPDSMTAADVERVLSQLQLER